MARISGVDLPNDKRVEIGIRYIFGIGISRSKEIIKATGINPNTRIKNLTSEEVTKLRSFIEKNFKVEGDLRREVQQNVRRLIEIGSYRGQRHRKGLPSRGQRTHTNARTRKGPRRTVGGLKKVESKT